MTTIKKRSTKGNPFDDDGSGPKKGGNYENVLQQSLEEENQVYIDVLSENVRNIKHIAHTLKNHLSDEKTVFDDLDNKFDKSNKLLKFTQAKMDQIMSSSSGKITCYLVAFIIFFFVVLYLLG